jgi:ribonuclease III
MNGQPEESLIDLLYDSTPDVNRIIDTFISDFNRVYGDPCAERWDITKDDWQRYEFLGDRVLNLVIAQVLFTWREGVLNEGDMTRMMSDIVSNRALDILSHRYDPEIFTRLIPLAIGEQNTYGERITGGAFEAFIGALYCEVGLDDVTYFVTVIMEDVINEFNPRQNAIGLLQEFFQKRGEERPIYEETARDGPHHKPQFSVRVRIADGRSFDGAGPSLSDARKEAAKKALDSIGWRS